MDKNAISRSFKTSNLLKLLSLLVLSVLLISCETVGFYTQAARGQLSIVFGRQDIHRLLEQDDLSDSLRNKLEFVLDIRQFAEDELLLPVGDNYLNYVDIERDHVVWNVFAAPEFSVSPVNWCFPIAGCVSYRGYFSEDAAVSYAHKLEQQGLDVYTGGVDAYSTLGWFDDPLLSTVIGRSDYQLAALIFHELSHQLIYVPGDTTFNESFATAVEQEGLRRWLAQRNQSELLQRALTQTRQQQDFVALVSEFRDRLSGLYSQELSEASKRLQKSALQDELRQEYGLLKQTWGGYAGYDAWFSRSLNNAQLSTVASYNDLLPYFNEVLEQSEGDMALFFEEITEVAQLDADARDAIMSR